MGLLRMSESKVSETERKLLRLLSRSLKPAEGVCDIAEFEGETWELIYSLASRHEVLPLLGNIIDPSVLPSKMQNDFQLKTARCVHAGIQLEALTVRLTELLSKVGITAVTLKGYSVSRFYPVPEFRKTSDVDLFLFSAEDAKKAGSILCENGFELSKEWHANHHAVFVSKKNEEAELHTAWADEFKDKAFNRRLEAMEKESRAHIEEIDRCGGRLYAYDTPWQAIYLVIHMLGHFVGCGFGLRNLCDLVVLWENCEDKNAREAFRKTVGDGEMAEFAKAVISICVEYLGLTPEKSPFSREELTDRNLTDELVRDILDAGEFGYSEHERMVGMDGASLEAYIKEFHHQMHINFPKAGRVILFWPVLWVATLLRFLKNNRKFNRAPVFKIIKKAGNRGKLVKRLTSNKKDG